MADNLDDDEVFDFFLTEFTRDDLILAHNEMVVEYMRLSQTFKKVKAKNKFLIDKSGKSSYSQPDELDSLRIELNKLVTDQKGKLKQIIRELKKHAVVDRKRAERDELSAIVKMSKLEQWGHPNWSRDDIQADPA
ncbi:hypothetical protein F511_33771 [Dorcoceras hygrometricum]|uniref:Uncharacterized protein n=1 Tax=Dorcoceras hygrometricum TaxID=472368 RepID=A0A2Z7AF08_9LAMI|nr:hypothetical protein F511_33771 [Dorcoceras hygrometricum]